MRTVCFALTPSSYLYYCCCLCRSVFFRNSRNAAVIGMCQGHSVLGYNWHQHVSCRTSDKVGARQRTL